MSVIKKTCTRCNKELHVDNFKKIKAGTKQGKQQYKYSAWCHNCKFDYDNYKKCSICEQKLPKTKDYFNVKITKQVNKNGEATYYSFKYACKKCLNEKIAKYKRDKYWKEPEKYRADNRKKYWKDPEKSRKKTQEWRKNNIDKLRERDRNRVAKIEDSWLASLIGIPVSECPKELLENKRIVIKLKRELGLTRSTIK